MEQKNLLLAIILSAIIMVGFQWYNESQRPAKVEETLTQESETNLPSLPRSPNVKNNIDKQHTPGVSVPIPGLNSVTAEAKAMERALTATPRLNIESDRVTGSISLVGARIDDLTLKNYRETIQPESKNISLLLPFGSTKPYYVDFGWVSANTRVPNKNTVWKSNNQTLTSETPVKLTWQNADGVIFIQEISLDTDYMFTINQRVENNGSKSATVYPFGRISRTDTPEITDFYILHEGMLGVFDDVLKEIDYDEIQENKLIQNKSKGGWIGITDKLSLIHI